MIDSQITEDEGGESPLSMALKQRLRDVRNQPEMSSLAGKPRSDSGLRVRRGLAGNSKARPGNRYRMNKQESMDGRT